MLESIEGSVVLDVTVEEIDAIIAEFEGDPRAVMGFVRGRLLPFRLGDGLPEKK